MKHTFALGTASALLAVSLLLAPGPMAQALESVDDLRDATVPSMCDHPAGTLVDGTLPGLEFGSVDLVGATVASIIKGGDKEAAATFQCSQGGIGWPDHVVFYDSAENIIGHFDSGTIGDSGGRQHVRKVSISKRTVTIRVVGVPLAGDNNLWGSSGAKITYRWDANSGAVTQRKAKIYGERGTAKKLLALVKAGKKQRAKKYAKASVVRDLARSVKLAHSYGSKVRIGSCYGPFSWDEEFGEWAPGVVEYGQRGCLVEYISDDGHGWDVLILDHPSSDKYDARWKAVAFDRFAD